MPSKKLLCLTSALVILCAAGCRSKSPVVMQEAISPANVDASRLINADQQPGNWMSYSRTYSEQRFSPLKQINDQNVGQLAPAWYVHLYTHHRHDATAISADSV